MPILLTGSKLSLGDLWAIANGQSIELDPEGLTTMTRSRQILEVEIAAGSDVYGTTTGLGPRSVEHLDRDEQDSFSLQTLRGRAHALGEFLPKNYVRAAMAVRTNTLLCGASGARPELAQHLSAMLNAELIPKVRETGSIGAADLIWGATLGLGVIGEGSIKSEEFSAAGFAPYQPAAREGLALASHSSFVAAIAALALQRLEALFVVCEANAALSLEGFRANLSPLNQDVIALRTQALEAEAAARMRKLLSGSGLFEKGAARRLQDPLSLRNIPQVHGAFLAAFEQAKAAVLIEINSPSDNPAVLTEQGNVISNGSFLSIYLGLTLCALAQALAALASMIFARTARMLASRFTGLNDGLAIEGAGLGPLLKPAEALFAEIAQLASQPTLYPSPSADGLEDQMSHAAIPAKALHSMIEKLAGLTAIEAVVAAQAIEIRKITVPNALQGPLKTVRDHVAIAQRDRAMGEEIEALAQALLSVGIEQ